MFSSWLTMCVLVPTSRARFAARAKREHLQHLRRRQLALITGHSNLSASAIDTLLEQQRMAIHAGRAVVEVVTFSSQRNLLSQDSPSTPFPFPPSSSPPPPPFFFVVGGGRVVTRLAHWLSCCSVVCLCGMMCVVAMM